MILHANIVDITNKVIFEGKLHIAEKNISAIELISDSENSTLPYITPGFIDSHVHIESSMLIFNHCTGL